MHFGGHSKMRRTCLASDELAFFTRSVRTKPHRCHTASIPSRVVRQLTRKGVGGGVAIGSCFILFLEKMDNGGMNRPAASIQISMMNCPLLSDESEDDGYTYFDYVIGGISTDG